MAFKDAARQAARVLLLLILLGGGSGVLWYLAQTHGPKEDLMPSFYIFLGLLALVFFFLGFFLKGFYGAKAQLDLMGKKLDEIRKTAWEVQRELVAARESAATSTGAESLERQQLQAKEGIEGIERLSARLGDGMNMLQRHAETLQALLASFQKVRGPGAKPADPGAEGPEKAPVPSVQPELPAAPERTDAPATDDKSNAPAWRKSLNNILDHFEEGKED